MQGNYFDNWMFEEKNLHHSPSLTESNFIFIKKTLAGHSLSDSLRLLLRMVIIVLYEGRDKKRNRECDYFKLVKQINYWACHHIKLMSFQNCQL